MPALPDVAAFIVDGVVVNVGALSTENDYVPMLAALADEYDSILIVPAAGIGWEEYEPGALRPPSPYPSWSWDGGEWVAPVPKPDGDFAWDEDAQEWKPVEG